MQDFVTIMAAPAAECLVLVGIHSYLGIHVLKRRVIFVDLSLAQIAALGATVGILFGIHDTDSVASFMLSMAFTFIGAAVFALSRIKSDKVPQEAVIGLVYAVTAALAVLVVEKSQGVEHLVNIMHGRLLWVRWHEVFLAAGGYTVVGILHLIFGKRFLQISDDPEKAWEEGVNVRLWDFFFYLTFGVVITFSVKVAGVLLVFVFLVAPAILAFMISDDFKTQLLVGWATGTVVTILGLSLSWTLDLPSGPTVVSFYGLVLLLAAVTVYLFKSRDRLRAFGLVGAGTLITAAVAGLLWIGGSLLAASPLAGEAHAHGLPEAQPAEHPHDRHHAVDVEDEHAHHDHDHLTAPAVAAEQAPEVEGPTDAYKDCETPFDRLDVLEKAFDQDPALGHQLAYLFLADGETPPFCRTSALEMIKTKAGQDFGLDPDLEPVDNLEALQAYWTWIQGAEE